MVSGMTPGSLVAYAPALAALAGRFEVGGMLGAGGMGTIFRARDRVTGADVALKVVKLDSGEDRARFEREAACLAELRHPAIVRYVDHGEAGDEALFLAMELLEGEDLTTRLRRGPLDVNDALALVRRVADALGEAHARGIVHRDLSPHNVFLTGGDVRRATVLDFGIAHALAAPRRVTATGVVIGTPGYMAPEQARSGAPHTPRVDVFALGCVLYECIAGHPAFQGDHLIALLAKLLLEEPPPLRDIAPRCPADVEDLVLRMLSKDPAQRPEDGHAVRDAIDRRSRDPVEGRRALGTTGLTLGEQSFVNVVLVGPPSSGASPASAVALVAITARYGARVARLVDGSLVAASIVEGEATDRAVQAARCALALRAALPGTPLALAGGRAEGAQRARVGDVLERAAALLKASRGEETVSIDETTAALLPVRFLVERDHGRLVLRRERDVGRVTRTVLGRPTPFVGREWELATLRAAFEQSIAEPGARVALVVGEPGAGKSRLREELFDALGADVQVIFGVGDPLRASSSWAVLADALRRRFGLAESASLAAQRAVLARAVEAAIDPADAPRVAAFLAEIAGCPAPADEGSVAAARRDPVLMGAELQRAWVDYLRALTAKAPVAVVLEDLHWADAASVKLCDAALRSLRDRPLFVLALARPDVDAIHPRLFAGRGATRLELGELAPRACEAMIRALLPGETSGEGIERLVAQAAGSPLYLEELIRAASLPGHAPTVGGQAPRHPPCSPGKLRGLHFPGCATGSLLAIVEARLSAYDEQVRRVLRAASVFGQAFTDDGVRALLGDVAPHHVRAALDTLLDREVIVPGDAGPGSGGAGLVFRHGLVREAAYAMLTDADRVLAHRLAGDFLEARPRKEAALLGHHFDRGGDQGRAARWYATAAGEALDGNDLDAALALAERAIGCGAEGALLGGLRRVQAEAHAWKGEYARSHEHGREALALLHKGTAAYYMALATYVSASDKLGAAEEVLRVVDALVEVSPRGDATPAFVEALARTAAHLLVSGKHASAEKLLAAAARHEAGVDGPTLARLTHARAIRAETGGDLVGYLELETRASKGFEDAGDARSACATQSNAGYASLELGDYERADRLLRGALATATSLGLSNTAAYALHNLGLCATLRGDLAEGERLERQALERARGQGDWRLAAATNEVLSRIALLSGDARRAEAICRETLSTLEEPSPVRKAMLAILAEALLADGRPGESLEEASEAMCILSDLGPIGGETSVRLVYAEALDASGDRAEALAVVRALRERILERAAAITDASLRRTFLDHVPENARALALAAAWDPDPSSGTRAR
jgi:tetratricopeptide (TPR) repeat protein